MLRHTGSLALRASSRLAADGVGHLWCATGSTVTLLDAVTGAAVDDGAVIHEEVEDVSALLLAGPFMWVLTSSASFSVFHAPTQTFIASGSLDRCLTCHCVLTPSEGSIVLTCFDGRQSEVLAATPTVSGDRRQSVDGLAADDPARVPDVSAVTLQGQFRVAGSIEVMVSDASSGVIYTVSREGVCDAWSTRDSKDVTAEHFVRAGHEPRNDIDIALDGPPTAACHFTSPSPPTTTILVGTERGSLVMLALHGGSTTSCRGVHRGRVADVRAVPFTVTAVSLGLDGATIFWDVAARAPMGLVSLPWADGSLPLVAATLVDASHCCVFWIQNVRGRVEQVAVRSKPILWLASTSASSMRSDEVTRVNKELATAQAELDELRRQLASVDAQAAEEAACSSDAVSFLKELSTALSDPEAARTKYRGPIAVPPRIRDRAPEAVWIGDAVLSLVDATPVVSRTLHHIGAPSTSFTEDVANVCDALLVATSSAKTQRPSLTPDGPRAKKLIERLTAELPQFPVPANVKDPLEKLLTLMECRLEVDAMSKREITESAARHKEEVKSLQAALHDAQLSTRNAIQHAAASSTSGGNVDVLKALQQSVESLTFERRRLMEDRDARRLECEDLKRQLQARSSTRSPSVSAEAAQSAVALSKLQEEVNAKNAFVQELLGIVKENTATIDQLRSRGSQRKAEILALQQQLKALTAANSIKEDVKSMSGRTPPTWLLDAESAAATLEAQLGSSGSALDRASIAASVTALRVRLTRGLQQMRLASDGRREGDHERYAAPAEPAKPPSTANSSRSSSAAVGFSIDTTGEALLTGSSRRRLPTGLSNDYQSLASSSRPTTADFASISPPNDRR